MIYRVALIATAIWAVALYIATENELAKCEMNYSADNCANMLR